jgi:hypothetical protein
MTNSAPKIPAQPCPADFLEPGVLRNGRKPGACAPTPLGLARTDNSTESIPQRAARGPLSRNSHIESLTIAAGATYPLGYSGTIFQLLAAPCPVSVRYDPDAGFATYLPGMGIQVTQERPFTVLELKNPQTVAITITIFVGWEIPAMFGFGALALNTPQEGFTAMITGTAVQLSTASVYFRNGFFYGYQSAPTLKAPTNNAASINIGKTTNLSDLVTTGSWVNYAAPAGFWFNLASFYALGQTGDGIFYSLT